MAQTRRERGQGQVAVALTKLTLSLTGLQVEVHWEGTGDGAPMVTCRLVSA